MAQQRRDTNIPANPITERIQEFQSHDSILADGNPLFPDGYLAEIERQIEDKLREIGIPVPEAMQQIGMIMMNTLHAQQGHRLALESLAEEVVRELYGPLLENVVLDIQLCAPGQPAQQMEPPDDPPPMEQIEDEETRNEIYKRRVSNYLTSGAAISTHRIVHMPQYRDRLNQISQNLVQQYDELLKLNEVLDGAIPIEDQERMWREMPEGMAGSVKVEWPQNEEEESNPVQTAIDSADEVTEVEDEHTTTAAVEFEEGNEEVDMPPPEEERDVPYEMTDPIIHARGIDFPMLVHETVKGVYELIMANGIPEEEELAQVVINNADTYMQELVGHRVGPQLRQDLLEYINQHDASNDYPNLLEYILGRIITLSGTEFIALSNGILNRTLVAKGYIDEMIHEIVEELREYDIYKIEQDAEDRDNDLFPDTTEIEQTENADPLESYEEPTEKSKVEIESKTGPNYESMNKTELQAEMDKALDSENWVEAKVIGEFLAKYL